MGKLILSEEGLNFNILMAVVATRYTVQGAAALQVFDNVFSDFLIPGGDDAHSLPAVEAGENLGFLPGDMKEKIDPYLQPLYDALQDMLPDGKLQEYLERGVIQIAPLAFMRGRTLSDAVVILDEAQNATVPRSTCLPHNAQGWRMP